jgi:hypothetical protein
LEGGAIIRPSSSSTLAETVGGSVPCPNGNHTCKAHFDPFSKLPIIQLFHLPLGGTLRTFGNVTASRFALRVRET